MTYMWWAHDANPTIVSKVNAATPELWLKIGFLEKRGNISYMKPIAGITKMYTSGWKVNQNKCWYAIGSPPIAGLKNPDAPNLSVNNINSAAANVGTATRVINDDVRYAQAKS